MSIRSWTGVLLLILVASGCSLLQPWATDRTLDGPYDQVFQATLETLEARDFPMKRVDREEGRIETGKRPVDAAPPHRPVETVRAHVEREEEEVSVRLFLTFLEPRPSSSPSVPSRNETELQSSAGTAVDKSLVYDDYLDAIADRVRGRGSEGAS